MPEDRSEHTSSESTQAEPPRNGTAQQSTGASAANGGAGRIECEETNVRVSWLVQIFAWVDRLGDLWITKLKLPCKNILVPVSCGASYFEQTVADFKRIDSYPLGQQPTGQGPAPSLPICPATAPYKSKVADVLSVFEAKFAKKELTWDNYYELQALMLPLYPVRELRGRHASLRDQFNIRAPQHLITMYQISAPPALSPNTPYADILEDALYLQRELASIDTYRPHQELKRNTITFELFISLIVVVLFELFVGLVVWMSLYLRHLYYNPNGLFAFPFIVIVMMLGALGAAVSSQRRLQQSFDEDSSILNSTRYVGSGVGTKLAPFQGSVFAAVLLFLLYSGLLNTALPTVTNPPSSIGAGAIAVASTSASPAASAAPEPNAKNANPTSPAATASASIMASPTAAPTGSTLPSPSDTNSAVSPLPTSPSPNPTLATTTIQSADRSNGTFISHLMLFLFGPADTIEYAKILVYAFLAGFAERLVPDTLDRLTRGKT
jgi:uncharacterized membrane protein